MSIRQDVADIYAALGDPRAAMAQANVKFDDDDSQDVTEEMVGKIFDFLVDVPTPAPNHRHSATCHTKHVKCLASIIQDILTEYAWERA